MSMDPIRVVPRLCLALVTTAAQAFGQADHCRDVLRGGVFDQEVARTHAQRWSSAADYFCSDAFLSWSSSSDTRAGLSILIDGVPLGFSGQSLNQQSMQQREAFCRQSTRALSASDETSLFRAVANPAIVNAWAQCMDVNRPFNLIVLSWRPVGSDGISVQARFTPPGVMDAPVILQVAMLNLATQQSGLVPGRAITPGAGVGGTFMRTAPTADAELRLTTTQGDFDLPIPKNLDGTPAGEFKVYRTRYVDEWVNIGQAVAAVNLPERGEMPAASFPDVHLVATEPNVELRNVQWWCEARGDQRCAFVENLSIRRLGPAEYLATGTHRSRATRAGLQGDKYQKQSHAVIDTVPAQALVYGQTFVVEAPNDDSPVTLIGHLSRSGVFVLNPRTFQTDSRFRRTDDAVVGNLHYYTFECLVPQ